MRFLLHLVCCGSLISGFSIDVSSSAKPMSDFQLSKNPVMFPVLLYLRGGSKHASILPTQDDDIWMNRTDVIHAALNSNDLGMSIFNTQKRKYIQNIAASTSSPEDIVTPIADENKLENVALENIMLLNDCKSLRAKTTDHETRRILDTRMLELENAWATFVRLNPSAAEWEKFLVEPMHSGPWKDNTQVGGSKFVEVMFKVSCKSTKFGDQIVLLGDASGLGNWREDSAVVLRTNPTEFPVWSATVKLQSGTLIEYKYAIRRAADLSRLDWEDYMGNRGFKVPRRAHVVEDVLVEVSQHSEGWKTPRFLRMHRVGSSELFNEPEYAMMQ